MPEPATRPLGIGVVGCGGAGVDLVRGAAGSSHVQVTAVHDQDAGRAADLAARAGTMPRIHARLATLLADPAVDVVYVALPHDRLAPTAVRALRAGHHVLVEKPVATTMRGLRAVRSAARVAGRSVGVVFELRHAPAVCVARELVAAGAIGEIALVRIRTLIDKPATYWAVGPTGRAADPWRSSRRRAGGGVVLMNSIHQLDLVRALTGLDVDRVSAEWVAGVAGVEVEDRAVATLRFTNGAIGSLVASAHAPGATDGETIELDGSSGALRLPDPYAAPAKPLELYLRRPWGPHPAGRWISLEGRSGGDSASRRESRPDPWTALLDDFASAIRGGSEPSPGLDDAEAALGTVLAILRAGSAGRVSRATHRANQSRIVAKGSP
jgi:predicted dehydrogenase